MRRDGGVEGLVLEKVNGLPLDKRCVSCSRPFCAITLLRMSTIVCSCTADVRQHLFGACRLWKDEKWADATYTLTLLKQVCSHAHTVMQLPPAAIAITLSADFA